MRDWDNDTQDSYAQNMNEEEQTKEVMIDKIKTLSKEHYNRQLSFDDYRILRNKLLKKIDAAYNGGH